MKELITKFFNWFKESNRYKHFLYAIPIGIISLEVVIGLASGMEFKDSQYPNGKWDWIDWSLTILGGAIGTAIRYLVPTPIMF